MGENAKKIGEKLESFGSKLFKGFGWNELARDREIKCTRENKHNKETHGIDLLMDFYNPYLNGRQGIVVECKNRQMKSINKSEIGIWVNELINEIECAQRTKELSDVDLNNTALFTGLLLIHANDEFREDLYKKYISNIKVAKRKNPINILIAGNREIERWNALIEYINSNYNETFEFVYPSINGSNMLRAKHITINNLYSKYVFAQSATIIEKEKNGYKSTEPQVKKTMFIFDEICKETFKYAWSMFKYYQFQDADKLEFVFYPRKKDDVKFVENEFIKTLNSGKDALNKELLDKICIGFIDNRQLSPVDSGRR